MEDWLTMCAQSFRVERLCFRNGVSNIKYHLRDSNPNLSEGQGIYTTDIFEEFTGSMLELLILTELHPIRSFTGTPGIRGRGENNPVMLRNR